jgi:hypothetical protein
MFKRANKITSLLVAAASVATMVPAYAADVKKVDSQDGTVYNAVAYKNGTAYIDGEVNDTDAGYYYKDGKFTELDNVDSGSEVAAFGAKYAKIDDGKDYNVDLESGKVLDSDIPGDTEDDAASALRKETKDADRYDVASTNVPSGAFGRDVIADLTVVPGAKFTDNWYSTVLATKAGQFKATAAISKTTILTDMKGNFIDADYNLGKIKVAATLAGASSTTSASVTIENSKDDYKLRVDGDTYASVAGRAILGQDKDYIYRLANITVFVKTTSLSSDKVAEINGKDFVLDGTSGDYSTKTLTVIQKISKKQDSSNVDDGKYAANVYNYVIGNDSGNTGDDKGYAALAGMDNTQAQVIGGKLVLFNVQNAATASGRDETVLVQAATLKQKNGYYYTDIEDSANTTPEFSSKTNKTAIDTDVDGNIYVLDGGYIKKFDGTDDWTKIYKVDGSFDAISAYDKDNMVAWSQADEVYSVIGGKSDDDKKDDGTTTTTPAAAGWAKNTDGSWSFNKADGTKATGWYTDTTGTWYYSNANGIMLANAWAQDSAGAWYYLGGSGAMTVNAWVQSGGKYYYVGATGAMLVNTTTPDGYWVGADGAWV